MNEVVTDAQEAVFTAKRQLNALTNTIKNSPDEKSSGHILFNDVVRCVCLPHLESSKQRLVKINSDTALSIQYAWVLKKVSLSVSLSQVAASTTELAFERKTDMFELKIKTDPSHHNQAYVILTLRQSTQAQREVAVHLHCCLGQEYSVVSFPALSNSNSQILLAMDEQYFRVISNPDTQIHLT